MACISPLPCLVLFILSLHVTKAQSLKNFSNVSSYLLRFGYLESSEINDHQLNASLENFQKIFGLNTGGTNVDTLEIIKRPRCGCGDQGLARREFKVQYSFFPGSPKWPFEKRRLTYTYIWNDYALTNFDVLQPIISRAFARWSIIVSTFTFEFMRYSETTDIVIGFYSGPHGDGQPFDGIGKVLAHSFAPTIGQLHVDKDERWSMMDPNKSEVDFESVVLHEIGHILGLQHSNLPDAVMYPFFSYGQVKRELTQDDIDGIRELYWYSG